MFLLRESEMYQKLSQNLNVFNIWFSFWIFLNYVSHLKISFYCNSVLLLPVMNYLKILHTNLNISESNFFLYIAHIFVILNRFLSKLLKYCHNFEIWKIIFISEYLCPLPYFWNIFLISKTYTFTYERFTISDPTWYYLVGKSLLWEIFGWKLLFLMDLMILLQIFFSTSLICGILSKRGWLCVYSNCKYVNPFMPEAAKIASSSQHWIF